MLKRKKYNILLTDDEREFPGKYIRTGKHTARNITRARILLLSPEGKTDAEIVKTPGICPATVSRIRKRFTESGLIFAPGGKPFPGQPARPDGKGQATLTALACLALFEGHSSWTMQLPAGKLVEPGTVKSVSDKTFGKY